VILTSDAGTQVALVSAAASNGFVLAHRDASSITVTEAGVSTQFTVVATLEFTAERRRMSVLLRDPDGHHTLMSKGADEAILPLCARHGDDHARIIEHMDGFAAQGHRTLVCAVRDVPDDEASRFRVLYEEASRSVEGRDEKMSSLYQALERDMLLVGATCVEDKLQEEVPETVQYLLRAGMHVWILTGDKLGTAESVARSASIITQEMTVLYVTSHVWEEVSVRACVCTHMHVCPHLCFLLVLCECQYILM
jgi:magnesium-transporting ATPase (P-type)